MFKPNYNLNSPNDGLINYTGQSIIFIFSVLLWIMTDYYQNNYSLSSLTLKYIFYTSLKHSEVSEP